MASSAARAMWPGPVSRLEADQHARRVRVPVRSSQADKRRHKDDAVRMGHTGSKRLHFSRSADELEIVTQPLHHRAANEDAAFERILKPLLRARRNGRNQLVFRAHKLRADVLEEEAAGAIRILGFACAPAQLTKERRLLVAGDACDGRAAKAQRCSHLAHALARPHNFRQQACGDPEEFEQLRVPLALHDVEEQCARGVGHVGHVFVGRS